MGILYQTNWIKHWKGNINLYLEKKKEDDSERKKKRQRKYLLSQTLYFLYILFYMFCEVKQMLCKCSI